MKTLPRLAVILFTVLWLLPIALVILLSLHGTSDVISVDPVTLLARPAELINYTVLVSKGLGGAILNSIILAWVATVTCVAVTLPATYYSAIVARESRPGIFFTWLLSTRMVPPAAALIPFVIIAELLLLSRTIFGVGIVVAALQVPVAAWLFRQALLEVPRSYCEALRIDGGNELAVFWRVVLPLAARGLSASTLVVFVFSWNEYLLSSVLLADPRAKTLPLLAADFVTGYQIQWGPMLACAAIMLAPPLVAALIMDRSTRVAFAGVSKRRSQKGGSS